jgi:hypothetical protein
MSQVGRNQIKELSEILMKRCISDFNARALEAFWTLSTESEYSYNDVGCMTICVSVSSLWTLELKN